MAPNHISKTVLSIVKIGQPFLTEVRTAPFRATLLSLFHKSDAAKVVDYWVPVYAEVNALFAVLKTTLS